LSREEYAAAPAAGDGYVDFFAAGDVAEGEFRCSECGYGVAVLTTLPACPMCLGTAWERGPWTSFARADAAARVLQ
jgi:rubrerythrin